MARSTSDPKIKAPKGMMKFEVIRSTIKDSLGQYCLPGDMAILKKDLAQRYLDMNLIKVALPEFDFDANAGHDAEEPAAAEHSEPGDGDGTSADEQAEGDDDTGSGRSQGRSRLAANRQGRKPASRTKSS